MKCFVFFAALLVGLGIAGSGFAQSAAQYIAAGNQYYAAKDYVKGAQYYQAATQADPNSAAAFQGLGNCEYVQGHNSEALAAYEKALNLNPNNAQLSTFVQGPRAKVGASAPAPAAASPAASTAAPSAGRRTPKTFEIAPKIGVGVAASASFPATTSNGYSQPATTIDQGFGIGGGVEGYYLVDAHLGVGLIFNYMSYSKSTGTPVTVLNQSSQQTVGTATSTATFNSIEIMPAVKVKFGDSSFKPYLLGSFGFSMGSTSASQSFGSWSNGNPNSGYGSYLANASAAGPSYSGPMIQVGGGGEYSLGDAMNLFLQVRYCMIFEGNATVAATATTPSYTSPGYTFSSIPIELGMSFDF